MGKINNFYDIVTVVLDRFKKNLNEPINSFSKEIVKELENIGYFDMKQISFSCDYNADDPASIYLSIQPQNDYTKYIMKVYFNKFSRKLKIKDILGDELYR
jgi:hypothetical protein